MTSAFSQFDEPLAITMWDFSWIERRWPGAGYEDWDRVLDELAERGYNAVRIDAYPHLFAADREREWTILPCWNQSVWGSPAKNRIRLAPALFDFISKCRDRKIHVGLSAWFQRDEEEHRLKINSPEEHARIWLVVLDALKSEGLSDAVVFLDFCNEWPLDLWAPFFKPEGERKWGSSESLDWMRRAMAPVREAFPGLPLTFSGVAVPEGGEGGDFAGVDFLEPHLWMVLEGDFYKTVGYNFEKFDPVGYENIVDRAEVLYRSKPEYWLGLLDGQIARAAEVSKTSGLPLVTTECWSIVDYKDWPLLDWGWVKESTAHGVISAAGTGAWKAIATSNFCGPQFHGMWRDIEWHRRLTSLIRSPVCKPDANSIKELA